MMRDEAEYQGTCRLRNQFVAKIARLDNGTRVRTLERASLARQVEILNLALRRYEAGERATVGRSRFSMPGPRIGPSH